MADRYFQFLSHVEGLGYKRLELLIQYFGDIKKTWESDSKAWLGLGVDRKIVENFRRVKGKNISIVDNYVSYGDKRYPETLREIASPPIGLFFEGDLTLLEKNSIAVIGTRRMSSYGKRMTRMFTSSLASRGAVIVSGLASGVDSEAHKACIASDGKTIAVVAHGLDYTYPRENVGLRKEIVASGGMVVSEYPYGVKPEPKRFIIRNRIVAGLSKAVLVTEAPVKSGTKVTVGFAAEQGKDVYVIPGPIDSFGYRGSVDIIRDGGIPVSEVGDILI